MIYKIIFITALIIFTSRNISFAFLCRKKGQKGFLPLLVLSIIMFISPAVAYFLNRYL